MKNATKTTMNKVNTNSKKKHKYKYKEKTSTAKKKKTKMQTTIHNNRMETLKMTAIPIPPHYYSCMSRTASSHHGRDNKN